MQIYNLLLLCLATGLCANWTSAQNYPTRVIRIQTAAAGSGPDFVARIIDNELSAPLGQPVVVENRPAGVMAASSSDHSILLTEIADYTIRYEL